MNHLTFKTIGISLLILLVSNTYGAMKDQSQFTWNVQLAGYAYDRYDQKGEIDYPGFVTEFERFPWIQQLRQFQILQDGCSATLSVKDETSGEELWISIAGNEKNHHFLIGHVYEKEFRGFLGFGTPRKKRWLKIYALHDSEYIKECFSPFFEGNFPQLIKMLDKLDLFAEMEPQN